MYRFLSQFKLLNDFAKQCQHLGNMEMLEAAKELGYIKEWVPKKGCTYNQTVICTTKGRIFLKNNKGLHPELEDG